MRAVISMLVLVAFAILPLSGNAAEPAAKDAPVDYSRDVKPILSNYCYACHGPDDSKRKGKLRLDVREEAVKKAIRPGNSSSSPLVERIASHDTDVMPPASAKKGKLGDQQINVIRRWIDQGAKFDIHWAYVKPVRPAVPKSSIPGAGGSNPIDAFIAAKLHAEGLSLAPEGDRITLIRRLSFDLTGLPPTPAEVDAFVNDRAPDAYEKLVDRLLSSRHFGERMAIFWLDLVRFADTCGYHSDNHRDIWLYRDYVIESFNANKPFDRFTIEQLAGDLIPEPTRESRIASGYNRVLQTTEEGGAQAKEYTAKYAADRVRNFAVAWLATTMGCCECHNHKYDPFTTRDFYSMAAFFADVKERAVGRQDQDRLPTPEQAARLAKLDEQIAALQQRLNSPEIVAAQGDWQLRIQGGAVKGVPKKILDLLAILEEKRNAKQKQEITEHFLSTVPELQPVRRQLGQVMQEKSALEKTVATTLLTTSAAPRMIRILPRGNWLDDSGEIVQPNTPALLPSLPASGKRPSRLDLANWLVSPENPLTARVFVNRVWKLFFGQGIVRSVEDFGIQGTLPTHPELLDWLSLDFIQPPEQARAWDIKRLIRLIVTSRTYKQSSVPGALARDRDPTNQWLARQGRFRLDAELVRDNALAVGGLLVRKIGGPSVKPYQPAGYWQFLNFPKRDWIADTGDDQYRRGLYTYWQRTFLHPSLLAFDAPTREECTADRPRSSTPLQALVLLNDPTYVEAARAFAERIIREGGATPAERLNFAYRWALSRPVRPEEAKILTEVYRKHLDEYTADAKAAQQLVSTGQRPVPQDVNVAELAAWTSVARVILNLHEAITRN
jgi:mono/diheme cytochrome c family protein